MRGWLVCIVAVGCTRNASPTGAAALADAAAAVDSASLDADSQTHPNEMASAKRRLRELQGEFAESMPEFKVIGPGGAYPTPTLIPPAYPPSSGLHPESPRRRFEEMDLRFALGQMNVASRACGPRSTNAVMQVEIVPPGVVKTLSLPTDPYTAAVYACIVEHFKALTLPSYDHQRRVVEFTLPR